MRCAIQLNPLNPSAAAIAAAKHILNRTAAYHNQGASFAVETTLSSRGRVDLLRKAKSRGHEVHLVFIAIVRRRYARSAAYDNTGDGPRLVLVAGAGQVMWQAEVVPEWVKL